jgi:prophage regulatory protein
MLRLPELVKLTGLSPSSLYDRMNPASKRYDCQMPRPLKIGHASRWLLSEVETWIESKILKRDQGNTES